ncbi:DUF4238 domain-containing protein [Burkholderia sp. Ac-20384]|uniref:DUF4238 domain-containing protein n=1 Tax=Burkholderia sp. Ac-20384 TaxID=2703902 RepID=UPI0019814350|nr:DUF4238 domain-containing protein [Burkholderia sp. Ac-20384]MBN3822589.1 DUF4238 domain-containing protein [Burkholderia sp. Ac-20384]
MALAINQHWVPQFYLRGFTTAPNSGKVVVTDIKAAYAGNPTAVTKALDKVACMDHLYSSALPDNTFVPNHTNDGAGWDPSVDRALQVIETASGNLWREMREDPLKIDFSPGKQARTTACRFLASLHLRNPRMVGVAKVAQGQAVIPPLSTQYGRDAFHSMVDSTPTNMDATLAGIADREPFLKAQSAHLNDVFSTLEGLHWDFRYFPGNAGAGPLCTTDTPLFCVDHKTFESTSMDSPKCLVVCALTSRLLLLATGTPTTDRNGLVKAQDVKSSAEFITLMNQFIVHYGTREAYSGKDLGTDFPFLR